MSFDTADPKERLAVWQMFMHRHLDRLIAGQPARQHPTLRKIADETCAIANGRIQPGSTELDIKLLLKGAMDEAVIRVLGAMLPEERDYVFPSSNEG